MTSRPRQAGAALLMAMIVVTLVASLAGAALWQQWRGVEVEAAERARVQSSWILTGALDWGRLILAGDARESGSTPIDHLAEPWAMPLAEARLSTFLAVGESDTDTDRDAFLSGQITDLQSRLNVMNLLVSDSIRAYQSFERLFRELGLRTGELATLRDNLARAAAAMKRGNTGAPADAGDAPLLPRRFDQLAWLGVAPETLETLRPYVTVLPVSNAIVPVNLNTASALVIYAVLPEIDLAGAQRLVAERDRSPFKNTAEVNTLLNLNARDLSWVSVASDYFEIRGRLRLDDVALEEVAVVRRQQTGLRYGSVTLWRETGCCAQVVQ
ncbi:MAG: type II secretion system minor pseudopilin GspK [Burkholderiaceae bacterium]|jgi:general secretion pathway protein K|nr:type II secretion system minor pseudopilin GspK [Burkholderiaceae bacterium]